MSEQTHIIKACPQCLRTFPRETKFCGLCGIQLVERTVTEKLSLLPTPQSGSSYIGTVVDGRYKILRLIGRGGMGSVYLVEHIHMQRTLAMKLLHEDLVVRKQLISRFTREARAISRLSNPHTVRVFDFGRHEAIFYLVMEYLDGVDLEVILNQEGPLPWKRAFGLFDQICESLEEAHSHGIVHRDLKPENVMIVKGPNEEDFVKVLDFGLAKINDSDDVFSVHSHRELFGTPFYMAPEQIRQDAEVDHRSDIYALGCLLFRMLTNRHVYDAPYAFDVLRHHLSSPIPSVRKTIPLLDVPPRIDRFVCCALAKRPEYRYPDMATMRRELAQCLKNPQQQADVEFMVENKEASRPIILDDESAARLRAFEHHYSRKEVTFDADIATHVEIQAPKQIPATHNPPLAVGIAVKTDLLDDQPQTQATDKISDDTQSVIGPSFEDWDDSDSSEFAHGHLDSDDAFSSQLRRTRRRRITLSTLIASIAAVIGFLMISNSEQPKIQATEVEPNNSIEKANVITPEVPLKGQIGKRLSQVQSDRDYYRLPMGGKGRFLALEVSAIANIDLSIDVLDTGGRHIATVNNAGRGEIETLNRFRVDSENVIIVVSETNTSVHPTENISDSYSIVATSSESVPMPGEIEPNNAAIIANGYKPGTTISGYIDGPEDIDFFRIATDGVHDLRRWELDINMAENTTPEISLYRVIGSESNRIFSDRGSPGQLKSVYEEPTFPNPVYLLAVKHAGTGEKSSPYTMHLDLLPAKPLIAHEQDDDRANATKVSIGQSVSGILENSRDQDTFAIPITDSRYPEIELVVDHSIRERVRLSFSDGMGKNRRDYPPENKTSRRTPQPHLTQKTPRYKGSGNMYYLTVSSIKRRSRNVSYSFRVRQVLSTPTPPIVGGPKP